MADTKTKDFIVGDDFSGGKKARSVGFLNVGDALGERLQRGRCREGKEGNKEPGWLFHLICSPPFLGSKPNNTTPKTEIMWLTCGESRNIKCIIPASFSTSRV